jgi:hypothetical protein
MPVIDGSRSHDRLEPTVEPSTLPDFKVRDLRAKLEPQAEARTFAAKKARCAEPSDPEEETAC